MTVYKNHLHLKYLSSSPSESHTTPTLVILFENHFWGAGGGGGGGGGGEGKDGSVWLSLLLLN